MTKPREDVQRANLANMIPKGEATPEAMVRAAWEHDEVSRIGINAVDPRTNLPTWPAIETINPGFPPENVDQMVLTHPKGGDGVYMLIFYEKDSGSPFARRIFAVGDPRMIATQRAGGVASPAMAPPAPEAAPIGEYLKQLKSTFELDAIADMQDRRERNRMDRELAPVNMLLQTVNALAASTAARAAGGESSQVVDLLRQQIADLREELRQQRQAPTAAKTQSLVEQVTELRKTAEALGLGIAGDRAPADDGWSLEKVTNAAPLLLGIVKELLQEARPIVEALASRRSVVVESHPAPPALLSAAASASATPNPGESPMNAEQLKELERQMAADREQVDVALELLKIGDWKTLQKIVEEYPFIGLNGPLALVEPGVNVIVHKALLRKVDQRFMELWPQFCEYAKWRVTQPYDDAAAGGA